MSLRPLPLAYSTNGLTERPLIECLEQLAKIGSEGVELLGDRPHWTAQRGAAFSDQELKAVLTDLNLRVSNVNGNTAMFFWPEWMPETVFEPSLSHSDPKVRQKRIDSTLKLFDWAHALGAPRVSVTSGRCPGIQPPEIEIGYFVESLHQLCLAAEPRGLQLSIEYEPGLLVERWWELAEVIDKVDHPSLGANLDLGHAHCAGEDPNEAIRGLAGRIWNIHLEDIRGEKHFHLIPGEGDMPFSEHFQTLREVKYNGMLTVELYTYAHHSTGGDLDAAERAFKFLKGLT